MDQPKNIGFRLSIAALVFFGLGQPLQAQTEDVPTADRKGEILQAIALQKGMLGLCPDEETLPAESVDFSEIYTHQNGNLLAQILCWNAAYQGVYEFVQIIPNHGERTVTFQHTGLQLVGYPTFDPATSTIYNGYKFIGAGTCFEETEHYWDGESLTLISSKIVDGIEGGCAAIGQ